MTEQHPADVNVITAFPKSGITFLNYMLFHALFERPDERRRIDSDFIIDVHEHLARVPSHGIAPIYVKSHFSFRPGLPLRNRIGRVVQLVRDPVDVMMSLWDFKRLLDGADRRDEDGDEAAFRRFAANWLSTGGLEYGWAGSWLENVNSWLDQTELPLLVVRYEALKARPAEELARILDFLDRPVSSALLTAAVDAGKVDRMRQDEASEVAAGVEGAFYRRNLQAGYAKGYRFVGRLHQGAYETMLDDEQRAAVDIRFGPTITRVRDRAASEPPLV